MTDFASATETMREAVRIASAGCGTGISGFVPKWHGVKERRFKNYCPIKRKTLMKITVNGVEIPLQSDHYFDQLNILVEFEGQEEALPQVSIDVQGGKLDVYKSRVTTKGSISVHLFGEGVSHGSSEAN